MPIVQLTPKEVRLLAVTLSFAEGGMIARATETQLVKEVVALRDRFRALVPPGEGEPVEQIKTAAR